MYSEKCGENDIHCMSTAKGQIISVGCVNFVSMYTQRSKIPAIIDECQMEITFLVIEQTMNQHQNLWVITGNNQNFFNNTESE